MTGIFNRPLVAAGVVVTAMIGLAAPVLAAPAYETGKVTIEYSDINLASANGRQALDRRVDAAIRSMCGAPVFGTREEADALQECRAEARNAVDPQVRSIMSKAATTVALND